MQRGAEFTSPALAKEYLCTKLAGLEHEVFAVLLDTRHRLIEYQEMFYGTIDSTSTYRAKWSRRRCDSIQLRLSSRSTVHFYSFGRHLALCRGRLNRIKRKFMDGLFASVKSVNFPLRKLSGFLKFKKPLLKLLCILTPA